MARRSRKVPPDHFDSVLSLAWTDLAAHAERSWWNLVWRGSQMAIKRNPRGYRVGETHHRSRYSSETVAEARRLRAQGLSYEAIGYLVSAPSATVRDWVVNATRING